MYHIRRLQTRRQQMRAPRWIASSAFHQVARLQLPFTGGHTEPIIASGILGGLVLALILLALFFIRRFKKTMFIPLINTRNPFHFLPHLQIRLQVSYPRTLQIANLFILSPSQANSLKGGWSTL